MFGPFGIGDDDVSKENLSSDLEKEKQDLDTKENSVSMNFFPTDSDEETAAETETDEETEDETEETKDDTNDDADKELQSAVTEEEETTDTETTEEDKEETEDKQEETENEEEDEATNPGVTDEEEETEEEMSDEDASKGVMDTINNITNLMQEEGLIEVEDEVAAVDKAGKKFEENPTAENEAALQARVTELEAELHRLSVSEGTANKQASNYKGLIDELQSKLDQTEIDNYKYSQAIDAIKTDPEMREIAKIKSIHNASPDNEDVKAQLVDKMSKLLSTISGIDVSKMVKEFIDSEQAKLKKDSQTGTLDVNVNIEEDEGVSFMPM